MAWWCGERQACILAVALFGKVVMEIVVALFIIVGGSIALSSWLKFRSTGAPRPVETPDDQNDHLSRRTCRACGFQGEMKTWISHYAAPKFFCLLGFICGYIPGLIFLALYWGKFKCPNCGAVGKSVISQ